MKNKTVRRALAATVVAAALTTAVASSASAGVKWVGPKSSPVTVTDTTNK